MLCCVVLCYVMLCYVILCYVMLCYVILCYVILCYVMLCYVMLCHIMSYHIMSCRLLICTILKCTFSLLMILHFFMYSFRFVVNPTANSLDPVFYSSDCPVPWDVVDCVIVPHTVTPSGHTYLSNEGEGEGGEEGDGGEESSPLSLSRGPVSTPGGPCPICLGELKIPRMTKCGHLFW
jgi:hypothetical protein